MAGLSYVGKPPAVTRDVETKKAIDTNLQTGVSRTNVITELGTPATVLNQDGTTDGTGAARLKATKLLVDARDGQYAYPSEYQSKDSNLLVPNAEWGQPNGVATLNASGKVPNAQLPVMGSGIIKGPYGLNKQYSVTTDSTPVKIGEWIYPAVGGTTFGVVPFTFQVMAFVFTSAQSIGGRTVIEVRAGTSSQTAYVDQTQIAIGYGRTLFNDYQTIVALPAISTSSKSSWPTNTNLTVTLWMKDDSGGSSVTAAGFTMGSLFLARTAS